MSHPCSAARHGYSVTLAQMQRVKNWHVAQHGSCPVEREVWEAVLTLWVMGWVGWFPAFIFDAPWEYPLCLLGMFIPRLYVSWRARAHRLGRLRCDWLALVS